MKKSMFTLAIALMAIGCLKAQSATAEVKVAATTVAAKDTSALSSYVGKYKMSENEYVKEVIVFLKEGKLMSYSPDKQEIELISKEEDTFLIEEFSAKVIFSREKGMVKGVKIQVQGMEMVGEKLP